MPLISRVSSATPIYYLQIYYQHQYQHRHVSLGIPVSGRFRFRFLGPPSFVLGSATVAWADRNNIDLKWSSSFKYDHHHHRNDQYQCAAQPPSAPQDRAQIRKSSARVWWGQRLFVLICDYQKVADRKAEGFGAFGHRIAERGKEAEPRRYV